MKTQLATVHTLRACQLCTFSTLLTADLALHCTHPMVRISAAPVPCDQARRTAGSCGPDALRQHWPHLEAQLAQRLRPVWPANLADTHGGGAQA